MSYTTKLWQARRENRKGNTFQTKAFKSAQSIAEFFHPLFSGPLRTTRTIWQASQKFICVFFLFYFLITVVIIDIPSPYESDLLSLDQYR